MSRTVMIVLLVVCAIILLLLFCIILPRIKNLMSRTPTIVYIVILVAVAALTIILAVNLFGPKGNDSITSADAEGTAVGDAKVQSQLTDDEGDASDLNLDSATEGNEKGDDTVYVSIRGTEIKIGDTVMSSIDVTISTLQRLNEAGMSSLCIVDDYAEAGIYRDVKTRLDELDIKYREKRK